MKRLTLLVVFVVALLVAGPAGAAAPVPNGAQTITFNGNCTATFTLAASGIINEVRNDADCPYGALTALHIQFRPTWVKAPNPTCSTANLLTSFPWSTTDQQLVDVGFVGGATYNACFYSLVDVVSGTVQYPYGEWTVNLNEGSGALVTAGGTAHYDDLNIGGADSMDVTIGYVNIDGGVATFAGTITNGIGYWAAFDGQTIYDVIDQNANTITGFITPDSLPTVLGNLGSYTFEGPFPTTGTLTFIYAG